MLFYSTAASSFAAWASIAGISSHSQSPLRLPFHAPSPKAPSPCRRARSPQNKKIIMFVGFRPTTATSLPSPARRADRRDSSRRQREQRAQAQDRGAARGSAQCRRSSMTSLTGRCARGWSSWSTWSSRLASTCTPAAARLLLLLLLLPLLLLSEHAAQRMGPHLGTT